MFKFVVLVAFFGLAAAAGSLDADVHAEVKNLDNDISPEGVFHYGFQTSNGIDVSSAGDANAIQGQYKYISPDGTPVAISYLADAEGFKPSGEWVPTPPPIPEAIARSLQYIAAHPSAEYKQEYKPVAAPLKYGRQF